LIRKRSEQYSDALPEVRIDFTVLRMPTAARDSQPKFTIQNAIADEPKFEIGVACGEAAFVDRTYLRHHATATKTGARLVHASGFDSIPYDLGVHFTVKQFPEGPLKVTGYITASGGFSAGTFHSAVIAASRLRSAAKLARQRRKAEGKLVGRKVRGRLGAPRHVKKVGAWALPSPNIDPQIVLRSARALERCGPNFSYRQYVAIKKLRTAIKLTAGALATIALAQLPPTRNWLLGRTESGHGPSRRSARSPGSPWCFVGEGGAQRVVSEVSGGDPAYDETSKMLAESALCLVPGPRGGATGSGTPASSGVSMRRLDR
jgi:short subunit dehydrogenase-like uncharacterized protein